MSFVGNVLDVVRFLIGSAVGSEHGSEHVTTSGTKSKDNEHTLILGCKAPRVKIQV
jgi:hypothetical protein